MLKKILLTSYIWFSCLGISVAGEIDNSLCGGECLAGNLLPIGNGFLFSIEKNNKKSFILGTIHGGLSIDQQLDNNLCEVLSHASKIFVEADIGDDNATKKSLLIAAIPENGVELSSLISIEYYNFFRSYFVDQLKILTDDQYKKSRPWFIAMLIPYADSRTEKVPKWEFGTEAQLIAFAKRKNIPIAELEGMLRQYKIFNSMNDRLQSEYFRDYVELIQNRFIYIWQKKTIDAWSQSNLQILSDNLNELKEKNNTYSNFYLDRLIKSRNIFFSNKIAFIAENEENQLFAFGSDHLIGDDGVIRLLEAAGFVVRRLK